MSPSIDLSVRCGAWSLPLLILPYFLGGTGQTRALGVYTLALVVNYPHYMDNSGIALAATLNPYDSIIQMRLGRTYERSGDQTRMEHAFRKAILANPDNLDGQNALARMLIETGPLRGVPSL